MLLPMITEKVKVKKEKILVTLPYLVQCYNWHWLDTSSGIHQSSSIRHVGPL